MFKEVEIFICLIFLLAAILLIFNARTVVRTKLSKDNENIKVTIIKWLGIILMILSLAGIYYLK